MHCVESYSYQYNPTRDKHKHPSQQSFNTNRQQPISSCSLFSLYYLKNTNTTIRHQNDIRRPNPPPRRLPRRMPLPHPALLLPPHLHRLRLNTALNTSPDISITRRNNRNHYHSTNNTGRAAGLPAPAMHNRHGHGRRMGARTHLRVPGARGHSDKLPRRECGHRCRACDCVVFCCEAEGCGAA